MACLIRRVPLHEGASVEAGEAIEAESLSDAARLEPDNGVYAVFATWHGRRVARLSAHLDRLEDSARRAGFVLEVDRELLKSQIRSLIHEAGYDEARVRLTAVPEQPWLTISIEPYAGPPLELRSRGVSCSTTTEGVRTLPEAKRTEWLRSRPQPDGVYEQLLVDTRGRILEGASSNFYAILAGDSQPTLMTAGSNVLAGIARSIVLDVAPRVARVVLDPISAGDVAALAEAFITSSSRGIVPVVAIDRVTIGNGTPGPVTGKLIELYDRRATELEEEL